MGWSPKPEKRKPTVPPRRGVITMPNSRCPNIERYGLACKDSALPERSWCGFCDGTIERAVMESPAAHALGEAYHGAYQLESEPLPSLDAALDSIARGESDDYHTRGLRPPPDRLTDVRE